MKTKVYHEEPFWAFNVESVYCYGCGWGISKPFGFKLINHYQRNPIRINWIPYDANDDSDYMLPPMQYEQQVELWKKTFNYCPVCGAKMRNEGAK